LFGNHIETSILLGANGLFALQVKRPKKSGQKEPATPPAAEESGRFEICSLESLLVA
jgi:hypothetical protein